MTTDDTLAAVERWFRSRGIPHFIDDYSATRDVFTRALPTLTAVLVLELIGALNSAWAWWVNLGVAGASLGALLAGWAVVNRARHRPALARPDRVGRPELAFFVLLVPVLDVVAGDQRLTAVNTLAGNLALLGLIYLGTSYAVLPILRWAAGRLWRQLADVVGLLVRAMPLLLLFVTFLFWTTEVWQVAASLDGPFLAITIALFVVVGIVFVVARILREVGALARFESWADVAALVAGTPAGSLVPQPGVSPAGTPHLGRRQWGNVGLVVLLQVAGFLTAFSGFYFTVYVLTDATYRREFFDDVLVELRQAFAVRAAYLAARASLRG